MRPAIRRDHPYVVNHLDHNGDVARSLHDLVIVVVKTRQHGWSERRPDQTAFGQRPVLGAVELVSTRSAQARLLAFRGFRKHCRNVTVRRIDDQRCAQRLDDSGSAIVPSVIIGTANVGLCAAVTAVRIVLLNDLSFESGGFCRCEEGFIA